MNTVTLTKTYAEPAFSEKEILRYAGCREADESVLSLMASCIREARNTLSYQVCYRDLPVLVDRDCCDFGLFHVRSKHLAHNLQGCQQAVLFAATVGLQLDRLIAKYGRLSPSKALMFQAIGAERIEALCNAFCAELAREKNGSLRPRFSPGYGDLPLSLQKQLFSVLECEKRIGLFLNDSLLMSPSKSVTAIVGIGGGKTKNTVSPCGACHQTDCSFGGAL